MSTAAITDRASNMKQYCMIKIARFYLVRIIRENFLAYVILI